MNKTHTKNVGPITWTRKKNYGQYKKIQKHERTVVRKNDQFYFMKHLTAIGSAQGQKGRFMANSL
jgi:hypothetical protein